MKVSKIIKVKHITVKSFRALKALDYTVIVIGGYKS